MNKLTARMATELAQHEGVAYEAYRDVRDIWTWGVGITTSSGHVVWPRYVDNPQSLKKCLEVYEWAIRTNYLPDVKRAFSGHNLSEEQWAAALSFHFNTGGILRARWVRTWKLGDVSSARLEIMNWSRPQQIIPRRRKEQALFFDGIWSNDGKMGEYDVLKPSYKPKYKGSIEIASVFAEFLD